MHPNDLPDVGFPTSQASESSLVGIEMFEDDGTFQNESSPKAPANDFSTSHSQLPDVEEYKATVSYTNSDRRSYRIALAAGIFIVACSLFITLGVVIGRDEASHGEHHSVTGDPCTNNVIKLITEAGWSDEAVMQDIDSPQVKAATWLAVDDKKGLEVADTEEFKTRYALAVFYYALSGERWRYNIGWLTMHHHCQWKDDFDGVEDRKIQVGVGCDGDGETVEKLFLPSMDLKGSIPSEIGLLSGLEEIDLYNNDVSGQLPDTMQNLKELSTLAIHRNALSGSIPSFLPELSMLSVLDLSNNMLTGEIPDNFDTMSAIKTLSLEHNNITGTLDPLEGLETLEFLALGDNHIQGQFTSDHLRTWPSLTDLDISDNKLTGKLPTILFAHDFLKVIDLHGNLLTGHLPVLVEVPNKIEFLALHENQLSGHIDHRITDLGHLQHLDLSNNKFKGDLPTDMTDLTDLKYLFLAFNEDLNPGPIPAEWGSFADLRDLSLQSTNRNGAIPPTIGGLRELILLDLAGNELTGTIPVQIAYLTKLTFLILNDNKLRGNVPSTIGQLTALDKLILRDNDLQGLSNVCDAKPPLLDEFAADCVSTSECSCCTCCAPEGTCAQETWFSPQDPVRNYQYTRTTYKFNEDDIVYPLPENNDIVDNYNELGVDGGDGVRARR